MPRPPLNERQTTQALDNYYAAREQAVRYVLAALDPTAYNAPALPYPEVLERVQALLATERHHYAADDTPPDAGRETPEAGSPAPAAPNASQEDPPHADPA